MVLHSLCLVIAAILLAIHVDSTFFPSSARYAINTTFTAITEKQKPSFFQSRSSGDLCSKENFVSLIPCSCLALYESLARVTTAVNRYSKQKVITYLEPALDPPTDCYMQCTVAASDIQVLYWPVENCTTRANDISTTTASTPFTLVSDGFSYISPSVYVIYRSLCANANIGLLDLSPDPGLAPSGGLAPFGTVYNTTIGYPPEALSTSHCFLDGWKAMNYYDIQHSHSYRACGETSPYFSFPVDITTLDPAWSACKINPYGGLDPPRALDKAAGLISSPVKSTTTRLDPAILTPLPAAPGSRPGIAIASTTGTSTAGDRTNSVPQTVPKPQRRPLNGAPAQADAENDRYEDENKDPSHVVTYLAASFATTHQLSVAPKSDRAVSDSSSGVLVWNKSSSPSTPLLSSQALRIASADSNSPKSASTVSEGKHASPASLLSGSQQGLGKIDRPKNDSDVVAFTGGGSGKMNVMNKLCVAFVICMGFRAVAFAM